MTIEELIDRVYTETPQSSLYFIKEIPQENLITLHHTFGKFLRNKYFLWLNEFSIDSSEPSHPDDVSQYIIEQLWKRLQNA
jgi:hypothetical protein